MSSWMRTHAVLTFCLLMAYVILGTFGGVDILKNDLSQKYAWAAGANIGVFVDGLPGKPAMIGVAACESKISTVNLSWIGSEGATSYSINRNGELLASDFQSMSFKDSAVLNLSDYVYSVTAFAAGGQAISDDFVISTKDCETLSLPSPVAGLISFDGKEILQGIAPITTNGMFKVTGTSNISNANIQIKTLPGPIFISTLQANENGYWEYYLPEQLKIGSYDFQIIVTDPEKPIRSATEYYPFQIVKDVVTPIPVIAINVNSSGDNGSSSDSSSNKKHTNNVQSGTATNAPSVGSSQVELPGALTENQASQLSGNAQKAIQGETASIVVTLKNKNNKVYRNQDAQVEILLNHKERLTDVSFSGALNLKFEILDKKNTVVFSSESVEKINGSQLEKNIHVPERIADGDYVIRVSLIDGNVILSGEGAFIFDDMPIINFGGGITATYKQFTDEIGWVAIVSATLSLFFGFMFVIEFYFFKESIFTVDEYNLSVRSMISVRKGVPL